MSLQFGLGSLVGASHALRCGCNVARSKVDTLLDYGDILENDPLDHLGKDFIGIVDSKQEALSRSSIEFPRSVALASVRRRRH